MGIPIFLELIAGLSGLLLSAGVVEAIKRAVVARVARKNLTNEDRDALKPSDELLSRANAACRAGHYDPAILLGGAALEAALLERYRGEANELVVGDLLDRLSADSDLQHAAGEMRELWKIRNQSAHGRLSLPLSQRSQSDAADYLSRLTKAIATVTPKP